MTTVWRLITHWSEPETVLEWTRRSERIAIGHGYLGHLREQGFTSPKEISAAVHRHLPGYRNYGWVGPANFDFCYTMKPGDLVILSTGGRRALVVRVRGDYEFVAPEQSAMPGDDWQHQRSVEITYLNPDIVWRTAGGRPHSGYAIRWGLIKCALPVDEAALGLA